MNYIQSNQKNNINQVVTAKKPVLKIYQLSISVLLLLLISCSDKEKEVAQNSSQANVKESSMANDAMTSTQAYEVVPNEKVCMVNDRFMGVPQIAIDVNGNTYYGCCENCVEKLQKNLEGVRFGSNPLTDLKVDKFSAVIVQDKSSGSVFYFASKKEANTFIKQK